MDTIVETLQEMMSVLGRPVLGSFVHSVYYKEKEFYFQVFVQAVRDILDGDNSAEMQLFITDLNGVVVVSLADICEKLEWPIRYARQLLIDLIGAVHAKKKASRSVSSGCIH